MHSYAHPHCLRLALPSLLSGNIDTPFRRVLLLERQVGQVAAEMRALRPPDPYKNKGVRYTGERLKKKAGKAVAAAAGGAK